MLFLNPSGIFWNVQCVLVRSSPICTACTCTRRCTPQHQVKDGAGGNSDVIFESNFEFDFFGKSVQTHIRTAYCTYDANGLSPDCVFE